MAKISKTRFAFISFSFWWLLYYTYCLINQIRSTEELGLWPTALLLEAACCIYWHQFCTSSQVPVKSLWSGPHECTSQPLEGNCHQHSALWGPLLLFKPRYLLRSWRFTMMKLNLMRNLKLKCAIIHSKWVRAAILTDGEESVDALPGVRGATAVQGWLWRIYPWKIGARTQHHSRRMTE